MILLRIFYEQNPNCYSKMYINDKIIDVLLDELLNSRTHRNMNRRDKHSGQKYNHLRVLRQSGKK